LTSSIDSIKDYEKKEAAALLSVSTDTRWLPVSVLGKSYLAPARIPDHYLSLIQFFTSNISIPDNPVPSNNIFGSVNTNVSASNTTVPNIEARVDSFNMDVNRLMTAELNKIAFAVLDVIEREKKAGIPIKTIGLNTFSDPEAEGAEEIVFELVLQCSADDAMQYWSKLSYTIDSLKSKLSPDESYLLDSKVAVNVEWE
jgi:hypothetical protein